MSNFRLISSLILVLMVATSGIATSLVVPSAVAQTGSGVWSYPYNLRLCEAGNVFMTDQNTAWVSSGIDNTSCVTKVHWDGSSWQVVKQDIVHDMEIGKLAVISDDNIWAAGPKGIVHYDGQEWRPVSFPPVNASIATIQMLGDGGEGWAAGGIWPGQANPNRPWRPIILHYSGGQWEQVPGIDGEDPITGLHFTADGGLAVSFSGIWHYHDGTWSSETLPPWCPDTTCIGGYMAVRAISADEGWAVGWRSPCATCGSEIFAAHRRDGVWSAVLPDQTIVGAPGDPIVPAILNSVTFTDANNGWAVGGYRSITDGSIGGPLIIHYHDGAWHNETLPDLGHQPGNPVLVSVSAFDESHVLAVGSGIMLAYGYGTQLPPPVATAVPTLPPPSTPPPTQRLPDPHHSGIMYFPLVGHTLLGGFKDYWLEHGGLAQFGYPITEQYEEVSLTDGKVYTTQWFERARMEWHPQNSPPYDVLLGLLGREVTKGRESEAAFQPVPAPTQAGVIYFKETGHTLAPELAQYWQEHGGLAVYGYPISEPFVEPNKTDGKPYLVQYFERSRLEYHPEVSPESRVLLGLLGVDLLRVRGWLP